MYYKICMCTCNLQTVYKGISIPEILDQRQAGVFHHFIAIVGISPNRVLGIRSSLTGLLTPYSIAVKRHPVVRKHRSSNTIQRSTTVTVVLILELLIAVEKVNKLGEQGVDLYRLENKRILREPTLQKRLFLTLRGRQKMTARSPLFIL